MLNGSTGRATNDVNTEKVRRIDFRSDTVTTPTAAMREAMAAAEVGDDVYDDDPTVHRLQRIAAELTGKEAALFVPSGTMGNLISVLVHCYTRDSEYIVGADAHIHVYEQGGTSTLGGAHPRPLPNKADGTIDVALIESAIRAYDDHFPITRLVCLESTQNRCGGRVLSKAYIDQVGALCKRHDIALHMDGARLMNAVVASGVSAADMLAACDSVSICLSKGLAAPIGSVIAGTHKFIQSARRLRKALGGGLRQAGIICAAGILSLTTMVNRLADDHANARLLATLINGISGLSCDVSAVETNIVFVDAHETFPISLAERRAALLLRGIVVSGMGKRVRFVTHYQISSDDVQTLIEAIKDIVKARGADRSNGPSAGGFHY